MGALFSSPCGGEKGVGKVVRLVEARGASEREGPDNAEASWGSRAEFEDATEKNEGGSRAKRTWSG